MKKNENCIKGKMIWGKRNSTSFKCFQLYDSPTKQLLYMLEMKSALNCLLQSFSPTVQMKPFVYNLHRISKLVSLHLYSQSLCSSCFSSHSPTSQTRCWCLVQLEVSFCLKGVFTSHQCRVFTLLHTVPSDYCYVQ